MTWVSIQTCLYFLDDSALALIMHTARDDTETMKRQETETFLPGEGELRTTQPDNEPNQGKEQQQ